MAKLKREQLFVEPKVQGALLLRTIIYWFTCVTCVALLVFTWRLFTNSTRSADALVSDLCVYVGPVIIASLLMLPLVMFDVMQFSNRFTGPLVRLRLSLRTLARGESVRAIQFRQGDYWEEIAEEFNALVARLDQEKAHQAGVEEASALSQPSGRQQFRVGLNSPTAHLATTLTSRHRAWEERSILPLHADQADNDYREERFSEEQVLSEATVGAGIDHDELSGGRAPD